MAYSVASCRLIVARGVDVVCSRSRVGQWISCCLMGSGKSIGMLYVVQLLSSAAGVGGRAFCVLFIGCCGRLASTTTEVAWRRRLLESVASCRSATEVDGVLVQTVFWDVKLVFFDVKLAFKVRLGCASRVSESAMTSARVSLLCCTRWTGVCAVWSSAGPPGLLVFWR